jgi:hypothetical protein
VTSVTASQMGGNAVWAKLAVEDGKYRMVSRKGAGRVENLISACACFGGNLFLIFVVKNHILNYSETLRRKTLSVSSPTTVTTATVWPPMTIGKFFTSCRDAAGRETVCGRERVSES